MPFFFTIPISFWLLGLSSCHLIVIPKELLKRRGILARFVCAIFLKPECHTEPDRRKEKSKCLPVNNLLFTKMKTYFVYILKCSDNTFYTGFTSNLEKRLQQHNEGYDTKAYTFKRRPTELHWYKQFTDPNQAIIVEKQIKGWSHRKKLALIKEDWPKLKEYSKNRYNSKASEKKTTEIPPRKDFD